MFEFYWTVSDIIGIGFLIVAALILAVSVPYMWLKEKWESRARSRANGEYE